MNNREAHATAASLDPLLTLLLTIAGEKTMAAGECPMSVSRNGRPANGRTLDLGKASTMLRSVRRQPQTFGPFLSLILALCRRRRGAIAASGDCSVVPGGALFVVRYCSR
jgi:hypothetical protein